VVVVSAKGGVGKTATAVNLAAALAKMAGETLLVDADTQAGASLGLGIARSALGPSLAHSLLDGLPIERTIRRTGVPGLHLVTGSPDLASTDVALAEAPHRELFLRRLVGVVRRRFRAIVIDCPCGLSLLQLNALAAADGVLGVTAPQYLALEGLVGILHTARHVRRRFNRRLRLLGIALTMVDRRSRAAAEVRAMVRGHYGRAVFRTEIPMSLRLAEAPSFGKTIFEYAPRSSAAASYAELARETVRRTKRLAPI
jgi:chromosome partitioning protein